jgi:LacI family transcriptional regulator
VFDRFAFCGVSNVTWSAYRKEGFISAIGKDVSEVPTFQRPLSWWEKTENIDGLTAWISSLTLPVAIFACNDTAGLKLTSVCNKMGIAIPESVAIIGVDNEDIICELATPSLSSIMLDCEEIGFEAAALMNELIVSKPSSHKSSDNKNGDNQSFHLVKPRGVVGRESTRTFAYESDLVNQAMSIIHREARFGLNVGDVISRVAASPRNLEMKFRSYVGHSIHDEIIVSRLDYAKMLLTESSAPLHVVAEESGFGSLQRFHETFRKVEGCTPNEYRKKHINRNL